MNYWMSVDIGQDVLIDEFGLDNSPLVRSTKGDTAEHAMAIDPVRSRPRVSFVTGDPPLRTYSCSQVGCTCSQRGCIRSRTLLLWCR